MKRGELWTVSGSGDYAGKARPALIVQDDRFNETLSITTCLVTSSAAYAPLARIVIEPTPSNGLRASSRVMIDKITTVPKSKLESRIGALDPADLARIDRALLIFLGLAG